MGIVTARVPDDKKVQAQKVAKELGFSLSNLVNMWINDLIRTKSISVSIEDTHASYYDSQDALEVDESLDTVIDFLDDSLASKKN